MNPNRNLRILSTSIIVLFLILIFARDILRVGVPLSVFTLLWVFGLLIWNDNEGAAYTTAATVCFANSISITIPIFVYIFLFFLRRKKISISGVLVCSILIIFLEASKFFQYPEQKVRLYVNYCMIILLVSTIVTAQIKKHLFDSFLFLKVFIGAFFFLSSDILILTMRKYGSLSAIMRLSFRIGQTGFSEEVSTSTMSMNANGIGLLAIISISCLIILCHYKKIEKATGYILGSYFSLIGFLTISKTFFLIFAIMMSLFIIDNSITNSRKPIKVFSLFFIVAFFFFVFCNTPLYHNIMLRFETGDISTGRFDVTNEYLVFMKGNVLNRIFGIGLQNVNFKAGIAHVPHNAILEVFVCFGYLGLILYGMFFINVITNSERRYFEMYKKRIPFINFIPFICYLSFIQGLQFLRISYIYTSLILIVMCLLASNIDEKMNGKNA